MVSNIPRQTDARGSSPAAFTHVDQPPASPSRPTSAGTPRRDGANASPALEGLMPRTQVACSSASRPEIGLLNRAKANDPEVFKVSMHETKSVNILAGQRMHAFTHGLCGCTGASIVSRHPDGTRTVTISHHPPTSTDQQIEELIAKLDNHGYSNNAVKHQFFIQTPEDDYSLPEELRSNSDAAQKIYDHLSPYFPRIGLNKIAYDMYMSSSESAAFILEIPRNPAAGVRYYGMQEGHCDF